MCRLRALYLLCLAVVIPIADSGTRLYLTVQRIHINRKTLWRHTLGLTGSWLRLIRVKHCLGKQNQSGEVAAIRSCTSAHAHNVLTGHRSLYKAQSSAVTLIYQLQEENDYREHLINTMNNGCIAVLSPSFSIFPSSSSSSFTFSLPPLNLSPFLFPALSFDLTPSSN